MPAEEPTAEEQRLATNYVDWLRWGPYLAERAWGTVREDYSADGDAWAYFPHDHARSRAYRWNEDGLAGISDDEGRLCFALALWNGRDPFLKERLFGLANPQGNHGEDVKEVYYYLDSTPSHSYMKMLYRYPQAPFPYAQLVEENQRRGKWDPEFEVTDTGVFDEGRYFDVEVEYARATPDDILIHITVTNCGPERASLAVLPTLWFRNVWSWDRDARRPLMHREKSPWQGVEVVESHHWLPHAGAWVLGSYALYCDHPVELLFTDNETNRERLWGEANRQPWVKDAFHRYVVDGESSSVNPEQSGTKAAALYHLEIAPGASQTVRLRLVALSVPRRRVLEVAKPTPSLVPRDRPGSIDRSAATPLGEELGHPFEQFVAILQQRREEADAFYRRLQRPICEEAEPAVQEELSLVHRQALAGMLWSKQFYHYIVRRWLEGDPAMPPPPPERLDGRNSKWLHFYAERVFSMPDKWEYPWFAAWDLAFHCLPLALADSHFAKYQLDQLTREWSQHPSGQIPAYEWKFSDVNPPVVSWAVWQVYLMEKERNPQPDLPFLERLFHKLMLTFTWWVNRKDLDGNNIFQGGFLGLDNIGVFDRSAPLPGGGRMEQSDGTAWMGFFSLQMLAIALELARSNAVYQDIATKFFEHYLDIAYAMGNVGGQGISLWDEEDGFFYDAVHLPDGKYHLLKVRSIVGLIPLFAATVIESSTLDLLPEFRERLEWYLNYRPELNDLVCRWEEPGEGSRRLLTLVRDERLRALLRRALDPDEFLSPFGIRSLSKYHEAHPYVLQVAGTKYVVEYEPGVSRSNLFGGNSNWRGPIWFPFNYLFIQSLRKYHAYYGERFQVEFPTGSGVLLTLDQVADQISQRLITLFLPGESGTRPYASASDGTVGMGEQEQGDRLLFYEYFHAETGMGLGASHQTGWTGLVANLIEEQMERKRGPQV